MTHYPGISRTVLSARHAGMPMPVRTTPDDTPSVRWPSERHLLRGLACRHCGARVIVDDAPSATHPMVDLACWMCSRVCAELVHDSTRPRMTPAEWHALPTEQGKRGPKPKPVEQRAPQRFAACVDCGQPTFRQRAQRCRPCWDRHVGETANVARLIVLLGDGQPARRRDLANQLGITYGAFRHVVQRARHNGRPLVSVGRDYLRLEVQP